MESACLLATLQLTGILLCSVSAVEKDVISSFSRHRSRCWRGRKHCRTYTMASGGLFKDSKHEFTEQLSCSYQKK